MAAETAAITVAVVGRTTDGARLRAAEVGMGVVTPDGERPLDLAKPSPSMEAVVATATMVEVEAEAEVGEGVTRTTRQLWLRKSRTLG